MSKQVSIIIPACNEESTLPGVLSSCQQLDPHEIIVVANGCTDRTVEIARKFNCQIIVESLALGNDVGRMIGARQATGEILLFLDADFAINPSELREMLRPLLTGSVDVILNDFDFLFKEKKFPHSTTIWRQVFNELLGRKELGIDSVLSVPHAFTRQVLELIGVESLANPIVAQMKLITGGFRIAHDYGIDVIRLNRFRPEEHATSSAILSRSEKRIIGDHLEALSISSALQSTRGGFPDGGRRRDIVREIQNGQRTLTVYPGWGTQRSSLYRGQQVSVIIPAQNEQFTIGDVIKNVRKIEPKEVLVIVNGSTDQTERIARQCGATTIVVEEPLGNDVGRAIGAEFATGDILLFLDGDFVLEPEQLFPFTQAIARGKHVALNDLNYYLTLRLPLNFVTALKYAINLAANRKELGVGSLVAVPHALSRTALDHIHWTALVSPVLAQMKAMLSPPLQIECVHLVDVDRINRIRPDQHFATEGYPPAVDRIIGDHLEALSYLIKREGQRGVFKQNYRRLPH
ncbi:glycosyl transferase [Ammoniphilus oxalaticus]|uniref:Glycosyl transferase n=1 Tax=Ammoniphilus oxalaticus TaxID=66863 RepID=A0A419SL20_9BACL|nr:glycosyltransferase [Ammoniphilus oxalaticus]RKD24608.1 glycosyl transferase [Ammoniphilus oxalaticus]